MKVFKTNVLRVAVILLLIEVSMIGCSDDHFDLNFTTQNNFDLDYDLHEIEVSTVQDHPLFLSFIINKKDTVYPLLGKKPDESDFIYEYDKCCSVRYIDGDIESVKGAWFTIKRKDDYTISIALKENAEELDRFLDIELMWRTASDFVHIKQRSK